MPRSLPAKRRLWRGLRHSGAYQPQTGWPLFYAKVLAALIGMGAALWAIDEAVSRDIPLPRGEDVREEVSVGVRGRVDGVQWHLASGGPGALLLSNDAGGQHRIRLGDAIRPDAAETVRELRAERSP